MDEVSILAAAAVLQDKISAGIAADLADQLDISSQVGQDGRLIDGVASDLKGKPVYRMRPRGKYGCIHRPGRDIDDRSTYDNCIVRHIVTPP